MSDLTGPHRDADAAAPGEDPSLRSSRSSPGRRGEVVRRGGASDRKLGTWDGHGPWRSHVLNLSMICVAAILRLRHFWGVPFCLVPCC